MGEKATKYKSGVLAGIVEVLVTHPIDNYKTLRQFNAYNGTFNKFNFKTMYNGLFTRIYGIAPMRLIFWCTQDFGEKYFDKYSYKYAMSGALAGSFQTVVDYPIEQIKIRRMIYKDSYSDIIKDLIKSNNISSGFGVTFLRNVGFATVFNHLLKTNSSNNNTSTNSSNNNTSTNFALAAGSGFVSSIVTQPIDYFKTIIQSNKGNNISVKNIFIDSMKDNNYLIFFRGGMSRASISFLSMGIGFSVYELSKKYFNHI
jgi:hypothetical protein